MTSPEDKRRELLRRRLARKQAPQLSFAEERFWFLDQLDSDSSEYHITSLVRLSGKLRKDALTQAFARLAMLHESLRTAFPAKAGQATVKLLDAPVPTLTERQLPHAAGRAQVEALALAIHREPFDIEAGATWRAVLIAGPPDQYDLVLTMHHIVTDGWSMGLIARDLATFYNAAVNGERMTAPESGPQTLRQLAAAQRARLTPERQERLVEYWTQTLSGAASVIELPTDHALPALASFEGANLRYQFSRATSDAIKQRAAESKSTAYQVLLTLFGAYLERISASDDVVIGTSYTGRDRPGSTAVVGAFVNTLPLRLRRTSGASLVDSLASTARTLRLAIEHSELPFEVLIAKLAPDRDPRRTPLFNVFFELAVRPKIPTWTGLTLSEESIDLRQAGFDLTLAVDISTERFGVMWQYKTSIFEAASIETIWKGFEHFTSLALAKPQVPLDEIPLVSADQITAQTTPNNPAAPFEPVTKTLANTRARFPEHLALQTPERDWTYAAFDAESNRLAHALRRWLGDPSPGTPVCVYLPRCANGVLVAHAIWKAGCCYVPMDPGDPLERRALMLAKFDQPRVVHADSLARLGDGDLQTFDLGQRDWSKEASTPPQLTIQPTDPAYIIFTSGSTGTPKGIVIPHSALANNVAAVHADFDFDQDDRFLLRTPLCFDASLWEVLHPFTIGAALIVPAQHFVGDEHQMLEFAKSQAITVLQAIPSILELWISERHFDRLGALRTLISSGERLSKPLADRVSHALAETGCATLFYNIYGPTETCIDATWQRVTASHPGRDSVSIGKPIKGFCAVVVDEFMQPVIAGASGELLLGGAGLATGYLGETERTHKAFIGHDFGRGTQRWYRSGDLVRRLIDGSFEVLGRKDDQVKIHGNRIELGEIDQALLAISGVEQACAVAVPSSSGHNDLVAFVVAGKSAQLLNAPDFLASLPRYMRPSMVLRCEQMPRTPSEKIDRRALVESAQAAIRDHGQSTNSHCVERLANTATETFLAKKLARLLKRDHVPVDVDFFALGGHSLLATRLLSAAREEFEVELSLRDFLDNCTLENLALTIGRAQAEGRTSAPIPKRDPLVSAPLSRAQERLWLLQQMQPTQVSYNMPGALRLRGDLDVEALGKTIGSLVQRHEILRTNFRQQQGCTVQVIRASQDFELDCTIGDADSVQRELQREAERVFDLAEDALLVAHLIRIQSDEHVLVINLHHIIGDGWSVDIFARELGALYSGTPLEPLPIQFADFAAWERGQSENNTSADAWLANLRGAPGLEELLALPLTRPRPSEPSGRGHELTRPFPTELSQQVRAFAQAEKISLHATLLASFAGLLAQVTNQTDLIIGAVSANRSRSEVQGLIGFFIEALPVRITLNQHTHFKAAAHLAQAAMAFAQEHAGFGLDALVARLTKDELLHRDRRTTPLFQVGFDYAIDPNVSPQLNQLHCSSVPFHSGSAKLELNARVEDNAGKLSLHVEYATDLFDPAAIEVLMQAWLHLLEHSLNSPTKSIASLSPWTPAERRSAIESAKGPTLGPSLGATPLAQFESQVAQQPDTLALVHDQESLTYAQLDARAAAWASQILTSKAGPVAIALERSLDQIAAIIGTWKAGRAWLALDLAEHHKRRLELCRGSRAQAIVCASEDMAHDLDLAWIAPPDLGQAAADLPTLNPQDACYLIATSGTSGKPKWIEVAHTALANHNTAARDFYGWKPSDGFLHRIPLSFDAAQLEVLTPLALGASVILADGAATRDPRACLELAAVHKVSVLIGVSSWLSALIEERSTFARLTTLRMLVSGGERIATSMAANLAAMENPPALFNSYGPAEACIEVTATRLDPNVAQLAVVGRALGGSEVHVLAPNGEPALPGIEGEIVIGGTCLAKGYIDPKPIDAARFAANHLTGQGRLYWTGDRARRLPDGNIVFAGRKDREIKIGGRRVDPAEVEVVIAWHPAIVEVAVVGGHGQHLKAHVVVNSEPDLNQLREHCREHLPKSICPGEWHVHDSLPRFPSGKLMVQQLATTDQDSPPVEASADSPMQAQLSKVFAQHLGRDSYGALFDYFEHGGNSLGAIQLVAAIREALGVDLRLVDFFSAPSPNGVANLLDNPSKAPSADLARQATARQMERDAELGEELQPVPLNQARDQNIVLLTGATGFLGAFLMAELWDAGADEIRCIVRAKNQRLAHARLMSNLARYSLKAPKTVRIVAIPGDLSAAHLGLDEQAWNAAADQLTSVLHNGAAVDFFRGYEALRASNVEGTRLALRLAMQAGADFNMVSTIGVVARPDSASAWPETIDETTDLAKLRGHDDGYEQSKWVAESLVHAAASRGLTTRIFRPGRIAASHKRSKGAGNAADFASRFLLGCLEIGAAPDIDADFDMLPVDHVAKSIVALSTQAPAGTFHLLHEEPTHYRLLFDAAAKRGHGVEFLPIAKWRARLAATPNDRLAPIAATLDAQSDTDAAANLAPDGALAQVSSTATTLALAQIGITYPPIDRALADAAIAFFEDQGVLPTHAI